jgi:uncharacterized membrane protein HdeD (DUF308 family)
MWDTSLVEKPMQSTSVPSLLPHLWKSTLASGVLALALGILVLVWPGISVLVAAIVFGAYLLIAGVVQVIFALSLNVSVSGRLLLFISGAAALLLAALCLRSFAESILVLAVAIGVGFIFRGVATAISAISDPTLPGRPWHVFIGVMSLLAGIVLMASPLESLRILALVVGIWLIVIGLFEVASAFGVRAAFKALHSPLPAEIMDESAEESTDEEADEEGARDDGATDEATDNAAEDATDDQDEALASKAKSDES